MNSEEEEIIGPQMWSPNYTNSIITRSGILMIIFLFFSSQLVSEEKRIFSVVIHYLDGTSHTSVLQDCTTFFEFPSAQDTIILDTDVYPKLEGLIGKLKENNFTTDSTIYCDIRLTAIILYTNQTFDLICIAGDNYQRACVKYNGKIVGPKPDLAWLFFNMVYDINKPLHRRILFGIID